MKRVRHLLAWIVLGTVLGCPWAFAQTCTIGGHDETSEVFAGGGWALTPGSPGPIVGAPSGTHLVFSEIAPRGAGLGAGSDSSEYIEIYNPTSIPISLNGKYISDDPQYYRTVNGPYAVAVNSDYTLKFPSGLTLLPGRTLVLCVTKAGFAASGASAAGAQYFLEMKDSNANPSDDMIPVSTNSVYPLSGGMMTNPSATNGEWVVLYCWDGASDLVCDIDYASWGANSASNAKMDKTGVAVDGPDADAIPSNYLADTPAAGQSNLGSSTALTKPNTYQRVGGEVGETALGGNGCVGRVSPRVIDWAPVAGTQNIRFHIRWENLDSDAMSPPIQGSMASQEFGVFLPDHGLIGDFNVPPMQPNSFFDVFIEVPLANLPAPPQKIVPGGSGAPGRIQPASATPYGTRRVATTCPPDTNWAGNVDIMWSASGQGGQVNKHYGDLLGCIGGAPSYIHFRGSNCTTPMPWSISGVCAGYTVTLVNEDFSPAPNPVPVGWTGWISVSIATGVAPGTLCCFSVNFQCAGATSAIDICSFACECNPPSPVLTQNDWTKLGAIVRFHQRWENQNATANTGAISGNVNSQKLGVFLPDFGPIGTFNVPPLAPSSFFDVFLDIPLASLPPEPELRLPGVLPGTPNRCVEDHWHGNVNVTWSGNGTPGQAFKHFGEMPVMPGGGPTYLWVETDCNSTLGAAWSFAGICPGFSVSLVNPDSTPAPNPVPPGWIGMVCVSATAATPVGTTCCFTLTFICDGAPGVIDICAKTCDWGPKHPHLAVVDWKKLGTTVRFHQRWENPDPSTPTDPVSGTMNSQAFGAFQPDFGPIGQFDVPPIAPNSFFDVFFDVPLTALPPEPQEVLPGGGPPPGTPCPEDTSWSGNVDINWAGAGGTGQVNYHFTGLLVRPGFGSSHVHTLIFCGSAAGSPWSISGLCPGWSATLLNEDFTPAPNPVPPGWTGWISVAATNAVPVGSSCCFSVTFTCDGLPGVIDVCATACSWPVTGVQPGPGVAAFGIHSVAPNPSMHGMEIHYALAQAGQARLEVFNTSGQRVRNLVSGQVDAGVRSLRWDGRGDNGRALSPGTYFLRLSAGGKVDTRKVALLR
ncbi:MAG: T9SS type A sorting domain-containing protein [Candidatus Eisenbacteria bacterium]|nr:T9SS type A sorting domain-containing protein [Candidatus Eisenbacteria bacterium]